MSDLQKFINERDPLTRIELERVEREKKQEEEEAAKKESKSFVLAAVMLAFKKIFSTFLAKESAGIDLSDHLHDFKKLLIILSKEDLSHNREFTQHLSRVWHILLEDFNHIEPPPAKLKNLIESINAFPPNEEYPLGKYLTEYAGSDWLPFPFMDILHQLYKQAQENPGHNQLQQWIALIS